MSESLSLSAYETEVAVLYRLMNAEVKTWPFPHFYVRDVFPAQTYQALVDRLPADAAYDAMGEHGTVGQDSYKERLILSLESKRASVDAPWRDLAGWMLGERFAKAMLKKFAPYIRAQWGESVARQKVMKDARLVRDFTRYALSPHTDMPEKVLAFLFYLPRDDRFAHLGTSLYVPNDPDFTCPGGPHHPRDRFTLLGTADYLPNSLFGFIRTDRAFHGVEPVADADARRDLLLYNLYFIESAG